MPNKALYLYPKFMVCIAKIHCRGGALFWEFKWMSDPQEWTPMSPKSRFWIPWNLIHFFPSEFRHRRYIHPKLISTNNGSFAKSESNTRSCFVLQLQPCPCATCKWRLYKAVSSHLMLERSTPCSSWSGCSLRSFLVILLTKKLWK